VARGGGAALAALGGILLLGDELSLLAVAAIAVVTGGLVALATTGAVRPSRAALAHAVVVAVTIAGYSLADAHGIRSTGTAAYAMATFVTAALSISAYGLASHRAPALAQLFVTSWRRAVVTGVAAVVTYSLVQLAFRRAAVGYVTALRESSVVIATVVGWRLLGEAGGARRAGCALVVVAGLVLLVAAR
jgi:drug/metabolite transporter (DMT)-like permease